MKRFSTTSILLVFIALVIVGRIHLSLTRHIDPDEFAYLHWTYLLATGYIPYRDFFLYHIPLFQFLMLPIFIFPYSSFLVYLARIWEFSLYLSSVYFLARITLLITGKQIIMLLTLCLFLIFPMTLDKTIDIRPDTLMMTLFLFSLYQAMKMTVMNRKNLFIIGLGFGLSALAFPKILFALPSLVLLLVQKYGKKVFKLQSLMILLLAMSAPFLLFFVYLLITGTLPLASYLLTEGAVAVNAGKIPFSPWLALSPWPVVYLGHAGISLPWLVNTAIWILVIPGLYLLFQKNRNAALYISVFFAIGILFIFIFPAPYTQYFLPLSYFACLLSALSIYMFMSILDAQRKVSTLKISAFFIFFVCLIIGLSYYQQYRERVASNNQEQMDVIDTVLTISHPDETFYDMVGSYVFRPDGYSICCHPYAEFIDKLKYKPPSLKESLVTKNTKFVVLDRTGQSFWKPLPDDLQFLFQHYIESPYKKIYALGAKFHCANGICNQVNINNQPIGLRNNVFFIIIQEQYSIETVPPGESVMINGQAHETKPFTLLPGTYSFSVPQSVTFFQIRLQR